MRPLSYLLRDETGATAIEYGLLAAFVGVALVTAMQGLGNSLTNTYNTVAGKMANANTTAA